MLVYCWVITSQYWIDIVLTSRVCCIKGGGTLSLFARLPLIKPYNCEGLLCSRFKKYCLVDIVTWKHYNYILIGLGNIVSHVVLKWLQTRRIIKIKFLNCRYLRVRRARSVRLTGRMWEQWTAALIITTFSAGGDLLSWLHSSVKPQQLPPQDQINWQ